MVTHTKLLTLSLYKGELGYSGHTGITDNLEIGDAALYRALYTDLL